MKQKTLGFPLTLSPKSLTTPFTFKNQPSSPIKGQDTKGRPTSKEKVNQETPLLVFHFAHFIALQPSIRKFLSLQSGIPIPPGYTPSPVDP